MSYNLLDEPWIPVLLRDGTAADLSLRDCFTRADDVRRINGDLPTQGFAILRVLLAICHDAIGFHSLADTKQLLRTGLDTAQVLAYLDDYADRFDLFHPQRPFMQVADLRTAKGEVAGLEKLISDVPNGTQFLTVRGGRGLEQISAAAAARWLIHAHAFDIGGIHSAAVGDPNTKDNKGYGIGTGWVGQIGGLIYHGDSLSQTLVLNIVPTKTNTADRPVWALERPQTEQRQIEPRPNGPVEVLVWQSRRVRLVGDRNGVTAVVLVQGDKMTPENRYDLEFMTGWQCSTTGSAKHKPAVYTPLRHDPARSFWRGFPPQLPSFPVTIEGNDATMRSRVAEHLGQLEDLLPTAIEQLRLEAVGIKYGPKGTTVEDLINDTVDLRISLMSPDAGAVAVMIQDSVRTADTCVSALGRMASNIAASAGDREGRNGAAARARMQGWAALDEVAPQWIAQLTSSSDINAERRGWQELLRRTLEPIAASITDAAPPGSYVGRAIDSRMRDKKEFMTVAKAEDIFYRALRKELPLAYPTASEKKESA